MSTASASRISPSVSPFLEGNASQQHVGGSSSSQRICTYDQAPERLRDSKSGAKDAQPPQLVAPAPRRPIALVARRHRRHRRSIDRTSERDRDREPVSPYAFAASQHRFAGMESPVKSMRRCSPSPPRRQPGQRPPSTAKLSASDTSMASQNRRGRTSAGTPGSLFAFQSVSDGVQKMDLNDADSVTSLQPPFRISGIDSAAGSSKSLSLPSSAQVLDPDLTPTKARIADMRTLLQSDAALCSDTEDGCKASQKRPSTALQSNPGDRGSPEPSSERRLDDASSCHSRSSSRNSAASSYFFFSPRSPMASPCQTPCTPGSGIYNPLTSTPVWNRRSGPFEIEASSSGVNGITSLLSAHVPPSPISRLHTRNPFFKKFECAAQGSEEMRIEEGDEQG